MLSLTFGILYNNGGTMPEVNGVKYDYTKEGKKAAAAARKRAEKKSKKAGY